MISDNYNEAVSTKRLAQVYKSDGHGGLTPDGDKKEFQTYLSAVACMIQPVAPSINQDIQVAFGKDLILFCDPLDITEGDRIIRGSKEYRITGVKTFEGYGENDHLELNIRIFDNE